LLDIGFFSHPWHVVGSSRHDEAKEKHDHDAAHIVCEECKSILVTLHAPSAPWYCAPINATRSMCMFVTDHDLLPRGAKRDLRAWWLDQLGQAVYVPHQFRDLAHLRDFVIRSARSQCLDVPFGLGWLAVGDAAMAFDPLASQGIIKALDHGRRAATSISAYLKGEDSSLERFALHLRCEYAVFQVTRAQYYRLEQRWPRSIFWRRRNRAGIEPALALLQRAPSPLRHLADWQPLSGSNRGHSLSESELYR
jgi:2-polyprenyl-6-methoxyphenol hydroxylase-like FAD-dependent oxidoreductase